MDQFIIFVLTDNVATNQYTSNICYNNNNVSFPQSVGEDTLTTVK